MLRDFLSHFQVTTKNVTALAGAVGGYLLLKGRITREELQSYLLLVSTILAFIVPARAPRANVDPAVDPKADKEDTL